MLFVIRQPRDSLTGPTFNADFSIIYLRSITTKVQTDKPSIYKPSYDGMWKGFADENIFIYRYNYQIKTDFNRTS